MAQKKKEKSKQTSNYSRQTLKRNHRSAFLLNDLEKDALDNYCKKHKIKNKSKFIRETIIGYVMEHFVNDYPTLFDKEDLDRIKI